MSPERGGRTKAFWISDGEARGEVARSVQALREQLAIAERLAASWEAGAFDFDGLFIREGSTGRPFTAWENFSVQLWRWELCLGAYSVLS